jgi:LmbE family N-acetylglucosaminyl deacetylase
MSLRKKILVVAPHPDDEVLGVGGTLLKKRKNKFITGCVILTTYSNKDKSSKKKILLQKREIDNSNKILRISKSFVLDFPPTRLDQVPFAKIVSELSNIFNIFKPEEIYLPHSGDSHTDHAITLKASLSCCKWFRNKYVKKIYCYETLSETNMPKKNNIDKIFKPTHFVDITKFIKNKIQSLNAYKSQVGKFPFPRSKEAVISLAKYRGTYCGFKYAEAFELIFSKD